MKKTYEEVYEELKQKLIKEKDGEYYLDKDEVNWYARENINIGEYMNKYNDVINDYTETIIGMDNKIFIKEIIYLLLKYELEDKNKSDIMGLVYDTFKSLQEDVFKLNHPVRVFVGGEIIPLERYQLPELDEDYKNKVKSFIKDTFIELDLEGGEPEDETRWFLYSMIKCITDSVEKINNTENSDLSRNLFLETYNYLRTVIIRLSSVEKDDLKYVDFAIYCILDELIRVKGLEESVNYIKLKDIFKDMKENLKKENGIVFGIESIDILVNRVSYLNESFMSDINTKELDVLNRSIISFFDEKHLKFNVCIVPYFTKDSMLSILRKNPTVYDIIEWTDN